LWVEFDRSAGEIQRLLDENARVPAEHAYRYVHGSLNSYLNQIYQSSKSLLTGNEIGHRLDTAESI